MATALRSELEALAGVPLAMQARSAPEAIPSGIAGVEAVPRGSLTEISGPPSCGRTSVMLALMAEITARGEACALIDAAGAFDPHSAAAAGVDLERLLWIRCSGDAERALKAADLIIQGGGFGLVVFDLADTPVRSARRISMTSWFRLRRAVENTATALVVVGPEPLAKTCASLVLEMRRGAAAWSGRLLRGMRASALRSKPRGGINHVCLHSRLG